MLLQEVQKLNRENTEKSGQQLTPETLDLEAGVPPKDQQPDQQPACNLLDYLREDSQAAEEKQEVVEAVSTELGEKIPEGEAVVTEQEPKLDEEDAVVEKEDEEPKVPEEKKEEEVTAVQEEAEAAELPAPHDDDEKEVTATR